MLALPASAQPPLPGAIFTTNSGCVQVDGNIYATKQDVFLDGGPQHPNSASLPDGAYFVQVTDPSGATVLGTSVGLASGTGVGFAQPFVVTNGSVACFELFLAVGHGAVADGYDNTPNAGGEYKVWVSNDFNFANNSTKTDNFKVKANQQVLSSISGEKFYDANVNGILDTGELGIPGWRITIFAGPTGFTPFTTTTDVAGDYVFAGLADGTYGVCEVIPSAAPTWVPTTATVISGLTVPPDKSNENFGNVCLGAGGGLTLGFWSNKNGQKLLTGTTTGATLSTTPINFLTLLNGLNLRTANGSDFVLGTSSNYAPFRTWLLGATATNMAYMLSAQLATMELNVATQGVSGTGNVFAGTAPAGCSVTGLSSTGFISITALMAAADAQLAANGLTLSGNPARACQEFLKNALDSANNDKNFVQATACDVNYSVTEPSCVP